MAHLTAMKRRRAAVSWRFSQEVGKVGREERGRTGERWEGRRGHALHLAQTAHWLCLSCSAGKARSAVAVVKAVFTLTMHKGRMALGGSCSSNIPK